MQAKKLGYAGENLAADYLKSKGYEILDKNYTVKGGEIDLVAKNADVFVFVEIKTRRGENFGRGEESVDNLKKLRMMRAINRYIHDKIKDDDCDFRIDVIEIVIDPVSGATLKINHFKNIEI